MFMLTYLSFIEAEGTLTYSISLQGMWDYISIMKWFTRCCGAICYAANQTRNTGENALLLSISALVSFTCNTKLTGQAALRPIRRTKHHGFSILLKDKCRDWDANPHSADQRHQSLNPVLLSARPRH